MDASAVRHPNCFRLRSTFVTPQLLADDFAQLRLHARVYLQAGVWNATDVKEQLREKGHGRETVP